MEQWILLNLYFNADAAPTFERDYNTGDLRIAVYKLLKAHGVDQVTEHLPNLFIFYDESALDMPGKIAFWKQKLETIPGLYYLIAPLFEHEKAGEQPFVEKGFAFPYPQLLTRIGEVLIVDQHKFPGLSPEDLDDLEHVEDYRDVIIYKQKDADNEYVVSHGYVNHGFTILNNEKAQLPLNAILTFVADYMIAVRETDPEAYDPFTVLLQDEEGNPLDYFPEEK